MKRILIIFLGIVMVAGIQAQPKKSRVAEANAKTNTSQTNGNGGGVSARKFPGAPTVSEDVQWRRDIYRMLDLTKDANAPLYYPVEPRGKDMNLFTYVFRLVLAGRINAYKYTLDGNENFEVSNRVNVKELMENYQIYYEENDGKISVAAQDIPSAEVTRYYVKESCYFDQRTGTYSARVTALCPVLMRGDDEFSSEATPYPLFWLNFDEIASYLGKLPVMASNLNNVTNMSANDYFVMNKYDGKIYKTNNMQGRVLANYCKTDSAMTKEQKRIEAEIATFESKVWRVIEPDTTKKDSVTVELKTRRVKAKTTTQTTVATKTTRRAKAGSSSSSTTSRVSARRQRR